MVARPTWSCGVEEELDGVRIADGPNAPRELDLAQLLALSTGAIRVLAGVWLRTMLLRLAAQGFLKRAPREELIATMISKRNFYDTTG